jgi:hypothetical protein
MKNTALIPLAAMLLVGCATDNDGDGFAVEDDCNDEDAAVNPDGEETIGDGIDSNCDGEDPNFDYVGDWNIKSMSITYMYGGETYDALESYPDSIGKITITPGLAATLKTTHTYTDEYGTYGYNLQLSGTATPLTDVASFSLDLTGSWTDKDDASDTTDMVGDWECTVAADELSCAGTVTYDGYESDLSAVFTSN